MKKLLVFILIFLTSVSIISALCEEGQIDINSASKGELEDLYLIGPVKAEGILNSRPFDSVDELVEIYGIGKKTLEGIIEQGLACIGEEYKENHVGDEEIIEEELENNENSTIINITKTISNKNIEETELTQIILNAKDIKSEENIKDLKKILALSGIIIFCIIFGALFLLKGRKYKNEFQ